MKTSAASKGKYTVSKRFRGTALSRQHGMGATIILFTIALIVLVGAALAYASRGSPRAIDAQGARVYSAVLLKQSAEYRDGYSRYIFDGRLPADLSFNTDLTSPTDLFNPSLQLATYQSPPPQATTNPGALPLWQYNPNAPVAGVGTIAGESVTYVLDINRAACEAINLQMYGTTTIDVTTVSLANIGTAGTAFDVTAGRASGCMQLAGGTFAFYSTLGEA